MENSKKFLDCTFALSPYFGIRYKPSGICFNSFNSQETFIKYTFQQGIEPFIPRLLITRASCLLEVGERTLAFLDRRRLMLAAKIQENFKLLEILRDTPFPGQTSEVAPLEVDHDMNRILFN